MQIDIKNSLTNGQIFAVAGSILVGFGFYSFYRNLIGPLLATLVFGVPQEDDLFIILARTPNQTVTLDQARELGLPVLTYGNFFSEIWNLLVIAVAIWISLRFFGWLMNKYYPNES